MKRRQFVKQSTLVGGATLLTNDLLFGHQVFGSNKKVNLGIIGTGSRGGGLIRFINEIEGLNIAGLCDVLPFRLKSAQAKVNKKVLAVADYRKLLDHKDIDAVLIATPFSTHGKIALEALKAGKHVYCEKTMAKGLDDIDALVTQVSKSSQIFQTGHQYHSSRLYNKVVDMIKAGDIGTVSLFECQWNRNGDWRRTVPNPSLEKAINWRMYREFSGGLTAELSSHQIDFVNWVLGENPNEIMGYGGIDYWKDGRETFDNTHLLFNYKSGVIARFTCLTNNALGDYQIKVHGDKGTIVLDYQKAWRYYEKGEAKKLGVVDGVSGATTNPLEQGKAFEIKVDHLDPSKQALVDFKNSIINNSHPISDVTTGANTAKSVQFALDAMYQNKIVKWV